MAGDAIENARQVLDQPVEVTIELDPFLSREGVNAVMNMAAFSCTENSARLPHSSQAFTRPANASVLMP